MARKNSQFAEGYKTALLDIKTALDEGGTERVRVWLRDNLPGQDTPQQARVREAVEHLDQVLSDVVPAQVADNQHVVVMLRRATRMYKRFTSPVTTYDSTARKTAIALGEDLDES